MWDIIRMALDSPHRAELVAHLERTGDFRHVREGQDIKRQLLFVGALVEGRVVGHISLQKQVISVPSQPPIAMRLGGQVLWESYVQTFSVEETYRRQGLGTALQQAAMELSRQLGCYQMRSWSSLDKEANYALKLRLGFSFCPGTFTVPGTGEQVPGGWFVKRL